MKTYQFDAQLADGLEGEAFLDAVFRRWYRITPATRAQQRQGINRWFRRDKRRLSVEYKTDTTAARTGNAFVETVSVDITHTLGWAYTSQADYLAYYIPPDGLVYIIRFDVLRSQLPRWERRYPVRRIANEGYHTQGLLVALREFEACAEAILSV